jgi:hypothetical protein
MTTGNWPEAQVRKTFFEFFEQRGHTLGKSPPEKKKRQHPEIFEHRHPQTFWTTPPSGGVDNCRVICGVPQQQTQNVLAAVCDA